MKCETCKYYELDRGSEIWGICRRYPPTKEGWPQLASHYWCGEFLDKHAIKIESVEMPNEN